jgi:hypothetical protein
MNGNTTRVCECNQTPYVCCRFTRPTKADNKPEVKPEPQAAASNPKRQAQQQQQQSNKPRTKTHVYGLPRQGRAAVPKAKDAAKNAKAKQVSMP